jgi:hypothetical protein
LGFLIFRVGVVTGHKQASVKNRVGFRRLQHEMLEFPTRFFFRVGDSNTNFTPATPPRPPRRRRRQRAAALASRCSHHLRFGCYSMLCRTTLPKNGCKETQWRHVFAAKAPLSCRSSAMHVELDAASRALQLSLLRAFRHTHVRLAAACRCPRRRTFAFDQALKRDTS